MEIIKISEKYNFYQEGADYVIDLDKIKRGEDTTTELNISGIGDPKLLTLHPACGCMSATKTTLSDGSISAKIKYNNCDPSFSKVTVVKYSNVKLTSIKTKGTCH